MSSDSFFLEEAFSTSFSHNPPQTTFSSFPENVFLQGPFKSLQCPASKISYYPILKIYYSVCVSQCPSFVFVYIFVKSTSHFSPSLQPEAPQTGVGHMDSQACGAHSSTSNALMQEAVSPSKAALSVDTSGAVSPQSSTLSWMSETEDRGKAHSDT